MERQGAARILGDTGEQSPGRGGSETPAPLGIPDGRGRDIVTRAGQGWQPAGAVRHKKGWETWQGEEMCGGNDLIP